MVCRVSTIMICAVLFAGNLACNKAEPTPPAGEVRQEIKVTVDAHGYKPAEAQATAHQPVRVIFTRTSDDGCGQQLVFPTLGIRRDLPLNEAVMVDLIMPASGSLGFTCGMDMYRGSIVVR